MVQTLIESPVEKVHVSLQEARATPGRKVLFLEGAFGVVDRPTANGRVYPRAIIQKQIDRLDKFMARRALFGEVDHPSTAQVSLMKVGTLIESLRIDSDGVVRGKMRILDGDFGPGDKLRSLVDHGVSLGVSSRGSGSVNKDAKGQSVVQDDFFLSAYDVVAVPAFDGAYPDVKTVEESAHNPGDLRVEVFTFSREDTMGYSVEELEREHPEAVRQIRESEQLRNRDRLTATRYQQVSQLDEAIRAARDQGFQEGFAKGKTQALNEDTGDMQRLRADAKVLSEQLRAESAKVRALEVHLEESRREALEVSARALLSEELTRVPKSEQEAFLRLLPEWSEVTSFEQFKDSVKRICEDFESTGRYHDAPLDDLLEDAAMADVQSQRLNESLILLREASEKIQQLSHLAHQGERMVEAYELLSNAKWAIEALSQENIQLESMCSRQEGVMVGLRDRVLKAEARCAKLESTNKMMKAKLAEVSSHLKGMSKQESKLKSIGESSMQLEKSALQLQLQEAQSKIENLETDLERHRQVIGAPNPNTMLESLSGASSASEVRLLAEQRRQGRSKVAPKPAPTGSSSHDVLHESQINELRSVMEATQRVSPKPILEEGQSGQSQANGSAYRVDMDLLRSMVVN